MSLNDGVPSVSGGNIAAAFFESLLLAENILNVSREASLSLSCLLHDIRFAAFAPGPVGFIGHRKQLVSAFGYATPPDEFCLSGNSW